MKIKILQTGAVVSLVILLVTACVPGMPATSSPYGNPRRVAQVLSVKTQISDTTPVQVNAVIQGSLTESCAVLGETQVEYAANTFQITIYTLRPADQRCDQAAIPFETTFTLNTSDLPAGSYTVVANGVSAVFTLPVKDLTPSPNPDTTLVPDNSACVDSAEFVEDVTIPDNTIVASNTAFTKTWRVKNTGTCPWDSSYLVAYISGEAMSQQPGYWIMPQGQIIRAGQIADITVGMTAPIKNGTYTSYWGLKKLDGEFMSIQDGANGNSFYVKIKVSDNDKNTGNITGASIDIEREEGSGAACSFDATYFVHAYISADGPMTVTYEINSTAGQISAGYFQSSPDGPALPFVTATLVFDQADTKTIKLRFVGPYPYPSDITVNMRVNDGEWHSAKFFCQ